MQGYRGLIGGLFFVVALVLLLLTGNYTTFLINDWTEQVFLNQDSFLLNLLELLVFLLVLWGLSLYLQKRPESRLARGLSKVREDPKTFRILSGVLLGLSGGAALLWVGSNRIIPEQDQLFVFEAASRFLAGDYSDFAREGYMSMYPNQTGLFLLEVVLTKVFGRHAFFSLELLNVAAYTASLWLLGAITGKLGGGPVRRLAVMGAGALFLPLLFYTSFLYGNLLGLALGLAAFYTELQYLETQKPLPLLLAVVFIVLAAAVKNNYLIFMVALVLHALAETFRKKAWRNALLPLLVLVVYALNSFATTQALEHKTGGDLGNGVSTYAFIAMGLQENPQKCDGWYNEFNKESYINSGYNAEKQAVVAKDSIRQSLAVAKAEPKRALKFLVHKNASQWADPLFQSLWTSQVRSTRNVRPAFLQKLLSPGATKVLGELLDILQFIVYAGVLLYLIFGRTSAHFFESLLLQITVLGGFVFHSFWEAKGQYTISYYVLLLPLAVAGFRVFLDWWNRKYASLRGESK